MKEKETKCAAYEAPKVEVIEVEVEKGFANSINESSIYEINNGGSY